MTPNKIKKSEVVKDRSTGKLGTKHFYIKNASETDLLKIYHDQNTKPKLRQKCINELVRRRTNDGKNY